LKDDGHYRCWICGNDVADLQVHHWICEWSLWESADPAKVALIARVWDPYGYAAALGDQPFLSADDIRNLMVLCRAHHIQQVTGIHTTTMSAWLSQRVAKDGVIIVPQDRHAIEEMEARG